MNNNPDNLPGNKRDEEPDFSGYKSLDTTNSCEICGESMKCLCHVELIDLQTKEIYYWKAGSDKNILTKNGVELVVIQPSIATGNGKDKMAIDPYKFQFEIKNSDCEYSNPNYCSNLFFYQTKEVSNDFKSNSHYKQISNYRQISNIFDIAESKGKSDKLDLEFNKEYMEGDLVPAYLSIEVDEDGINEFSFKESGGKVIREPIGALNDYVNVDFFGSEIIPKGDEKIPFFLNLLDRTWGVMFESKVSAMPVTSYYLAVPECEQQDLSALDANPELINVYVQEPKALAKVHLIPPYSCTYNVEIGFAKAIKPRTINFTKLFDAFQFKIGIKEVFLGEYKNDINIDVKNFIELCANRFKDRGLIGLIFQIAKDLKFFLKNYGTYFMAIGMAKDTLINSLLEYSAIPVHFGEVRTEIDEEKAIRFKGVRFPNVKITGTSKVESQNSKAFIDRTAVQLDFNPLFGLEVEIDLAIMAIRKVPQLYALYESAKGFCALVNSAQAGVSLNISTNKNFKDNLSEIERARAEDAFIAVSLIAYFQLSISLHQSMTYSYKSSEVDESPDRSTEDKSSEEGRGGSSYVDFSVSLDAGVIFDATVWVIEGGFEVGFQFKTGIVFGQELLPRENANGDISKQWVDFLFFKGLDFAWTVEAYIGTKLKNDKIEGDTKLGGVGASNKEESREQGYKAGPDTLGNYDSLESAEKRYAELSEMYEGWKKIESEYSPALPGMPNDNRERANKAYPNFSIEEYRNLRGHFFWNSGHLEFYRKNQTALDNILYVNKMLKTEGKDSPLREKLLKIKFDIMNQLNNEIRELKLPLPEDGFWMSSFFEEVELRKEYRDILGDKIEKLEKLEIDIDQSNEKRELDKLAELDKNSDFGIFTILDPYFIAGGLKSSEEIQLKEKLLEKTREYF